MRKMKMVTGVFAKCPSTATYLSWLSLLLVLYGDWAWSTFACEIFRQPPDDVTVWQIINATVFVLWSFVNFFAVLSGCIFIHEREFRNQLLPVWWGGMWRSDKDVRLRELVLWLIVIPAITVTTLVEVLARIGSIRIRRGRS